MAVSMICSKNKARAGKVIYSLLNKYYYRLHHLIGAKDTFQGG